jgi:hypothetical protein
MMRSDQDLSIALQFIDDHIASFEELELLVALVAAPLRWWDATMLSRELGIPKNVARTVLERFARANLLDIRVTEDVRYQFRPTTRELHDGAAALATAYRTKPTALVHHLAAVGRRSVRDFADAFRFRRNGRG